MKIVVGIALALALLLGGFFSLNSYIYNEKQAPKEQAMDLSGTSWTWVRTELTNGGKMEAPNTRYVLSFEDGEASSTTDCNSIGSAYEQRGSTLTFKRIATTKMYCEGSLDGPYAEQLSQIDGFAVDGDTLRLSLEGEAGTMTFIRTQ